MTDARPRERVLSGMRPTGLLHLGHNFLLRKWADMQDEYECHYFVADYHALTTGVERHGALPRSTTDMVACWLAAGIDPGRSVIFVQSQMPEHAELHLLLSMVCPLPWLERIPTYREVVAQSKPEDVSYGFLGYPVLQAADIIVHGADHVPVGEDQEAHVELAARLARTFNDTFGKGGDWRGEVRRVINKLSEPSVFADLCKRASEEGDTTARDRARALALGSGMGREQVQRLLGWIEGGGRRVLVPPAPQRSEVPRLLGLDGNKMSKSLGNDIGMIEDKESFQAKINVMPTDPARVRRSDAGDPGKCPVWDYHKLFSTKEECATVHEGCTTAGIGCLDCKGILADNVEGVVAPLRERAVPWLEEPAKVEEVIAQGNERARRSASQTMAEVREVVGLPRPS